MQNRDYLAEYVHKHPDNKMAWYLLGKEYERLGELEKATFCFIQSHEVYEAFENDLVGVLPKQKTRRKRLLAKSGIALILILILLLSPPLQWVGERSGEFVVPFHDLSHNDLWNESLAELPFIEREDRRTAIFLAPGYRQETELKQALANLALEREAAFEQAIVFAAEWSEDRRWVLWPDHSSALFSATVAEERNRIQFSFYDAEICRCEPKDDTRLNESFAVWQERQEQLLVLRSAMEAYHNRSGQHVGSIQQIVRNYPHNILSNVTPYMKAMFGQTVTTMHRQAHVAGEKKGEYALAPEFELQSIVLAEQHLLGPLEIIVDKEHHRLAVVSGSIILRNYEVGLGGTRTPEGSFEITEKVKNPNGKTDGEFGSRGMTLSDTLYAIHGTNEPDSIGQDQSLGCVRMLNEDIEELFALVPLGTNVTIVPSGLPKQTVQARERFSLPPSTTKETNPRKVYRWLN